MSVFRLRSRTPWILVCALVVSAALDPRTAHAVPFRPDVLSRLRAEGRLAQIVSGDQNAIARGLNRPLATARAWTGADRDAGHRDRIVPDRNAIVILVDFSDKPASSTPAHFADMLFSVGTYPTGSMRDWYLENSYGRFNVTGQVTQWLRMPQPYSYYTDNQGGFGAYPRNAQRLAEDAIAAANAYVDYSQYDNDGPDGIPSSGDDDGYVDAIFVVHAGPGREETGCNCDIHSHAWSTYMPILADDVWCTGYSMEPETGKRGVFCHEFGHVLGLPDLYDTDYSSSGVGDWCCMSFGSWGNGGLTPVHFMAWCKDRLGFLDATEPLTNVAAAALPQTATDPVAYKIWSGGYPERQYFVVENRQRVFCDTPLPGSGILICHVDENAGGNTNEQHPLVMVEQADGENDLMYGRGSDPGDVWPGSTVNRTFDDAGNPSSRDYDGRATQVAVRGVTDSAPVMHAAIEVESAPIPVIAGFTLIEVSGNADADVDPGETWDVAVRLYNRGLAGAAIGGVLSCGVADAVTIDSPESDFGAMGAETLAGGDPPFRFTLLPGVGLDAVPFTIAVRDGATPLVDLPLTIGVSDPLGMFQWTHGAGTAGYGDQWHVSSHRNHSPGGSFSWKCGGPGGGAYGDLVDAVLVSQVIPLATVEAIRFWHWIDAEDDTAWRAWDGGVIEGSIDGGPWVQLTPDGGYPYRIIENPASPFDPGTPCFSGTYDWSQVRVDLTGLSGNYIRIRLRFGSDGYVTGEGWYLDDFSIEGTIDPAGAPDIGIRAGVAMDAPTPNPSQGEAVTRFRFTQPEGESARLVVVDTTGRIVKEWSYGAGRANRREIAWDGSGVASGVYFVRLETGGVTHTERFIRLR